MKNYLWLMWVFDGLVWMVAAYLWGMNHGARRIRRLYNPMTAPLSTSYAITKDKPMTDAVVVKPSVPERLEALAREAEQKAWGERAEKFEEYRAAHDKDKTTYQFAARRSGTFLTLDIHRGDEHYVTSVNLMNVKEVKLTAGHEPDREGVLGFKSEPPLFVDFHNRTCDDGATRVVTPEWPNIKLSLTSESVEGLGQYMYVANSQSGYTYRIRHLARGFPRPAFDDQVQLAGVEVVVHAPAGMGQSVVDAIIGAKDKK